MWFNHPKYLKVRSDFIKEFLASGSTLNELGKHLPRIIFICGGDEKYCLNRSRLEKHFSIHFPLYLTFRAEYAWDMISKEANKGVNALELEEWLADFSDVVIILVESFGTVAELGAFSLSEALRKKLLPILDAKYRGIESFINTGPVRWVDKDSHFGPSIYTDFDTILTSVTEISDRINKRYWEFAKKENKFGKFNFSKKVLLFFVIYVVSALGPVSLDEIISITKEVLSLRNKKDDEMISFTVSMGLALGVLKKIHVDDLSFYSCFDYDKLFRDKRTQAFLVKVQQSRARALSNLVRIPTYQCALREAAKYVG